MKKILSAKLIDSGLVLLAIISIFLSFKVGIFKQLYLIAFVAVLLVLVLIAIVASIHYDHRIRKLGIIIATTLLLGNAFFSYKMLILNKNLKMINDDYMQLNYALYAKNPEKITKLGFLNLANKTFEDDVLKALKDDYPDLEIKQYQNLNSLEKDYHSHDLDCLLMNEDYYRIFVEELNDVNPEFKYLKNYNYQFQETMNFKDDGLKIVYLNTARGDDVRVLTRSTINKIIAFNTNNHKMLIINMPENYFIRQTAVGENYECISNATLYSISNAINSLNKYSEIGINHYLRINLDKLSQLMTINIDNQETFTTENASYQKGEIMLNHENLADYLNDETNIYDKELKVINAYFEQVFSLKALGIAKAIPDLFATDLNIKDLKSLFSDEWEIETVDLTYIDADDYVYSLNKKKTVNYPNMAAIKETRQAILKLK